MKLEKIKSQLRIEIENGAMRSAPVYETHRRGKNWAAVIELDPKSPGGLKRKFLSRAKGDDYYYMTDGLSVGAPVEFGADYYTAGGSKRECRWYGVVVEMTETEVVLERAENARQAIEMVKTLGDAAKKPDSGDVPSGSSSPLAQFGTAELLEELRRRGVI